jgi:hypothetical protein
VEKLGGEVGTVGPDEGVVHFEAREERGIAQRREDLTPEVVAEVALPLQAVAEAEEDTKKGGGSAPGDTPNAYADACREDPASPIPAGQARWWKVRESRFLRR